MMAMRSVATLSLRCSLMSPHAAPRWRLRYGFRHDCHAAAAIAEPRCRRASAIAMPLIYAMTMIFRR